MESDKKTKEQIIKPTPVVIVNEEPPSLLPPPSAIATYGSLGKRGSELELAKIRQKERNIVIDEVLNTWDDYNKNRHHIWDYVWPTVSCERVDRIGQLGDGGKYICNSHKIKSPCVIYSFGCAGDLHFDTLMSITPGCEIFIFDPRPVVADQVRSNLRPNMHFHSIGLGPVRDCNQLDSDCFTLKIDSLTLPTKSLREVYELVGLGGSKQLDLLKLDIENSEYWVVPHFLEDDNLLKQLQIRQINIEFHSGDNGTRDKILRLIRKLEEKGFLIFQIEHNYHSPDCMEISFVHESFLDDGNS